MELESLRVQVEVILSAPDVVDLHSVLVEFSAIIASNARSVRLVAALLRVKVVVLERNVIS